MIHDQITTQTSADRFRDAVAALVADGFIDGYYDDDDSDEDFGEHAVLIVISKDVDELNALSGAAAEEFALPCVIVGPWA